MSDLNSLVLVGRLTRDPELRYLPQGAPVCELSLASNRHFNRKDGEKVEEVIFIDVVAWNRLAEICAMWITKDDEVERYLLLSMLHGGGSLQVLETPIRIWCKNTLLRALREGRSGAIRIRHLGDIEGQVRKAEQLLALSLGSFDVFLDQARAFAGRMIRKEALDAYVRTLVPDPVDGEASRAMAIRENLVRLFETGKGNDIPSVRGTLWAAVNSMVEHIDYERPTRGQGGVAPQESRWKSAQFGSGAALKTRAWSEALALLG
jgi:hypothetical protein